MSKPLPTHIAEIGGFMLREEGKLRETLLQLLSQDHSGELESLLHRIVEWEKKNPPTSQWHGLEWYMVSGDPRVLNKLVLKRILRVTMKTNRSTSYRLVNLEETERVLAEFARLKEKPPAVSERVEVPPDILDWVIGHEEKKDIIMRVLKSKSRVHLLLHGSVASAKSLTLECLSQLQGAKYVLGSSLTKAGLFELLYNEEPRFLILDELDKIDNPENISVLLSLTESGKITETKWSRHRSKILNTKVIAAANRISRLPPELLSRFTRLRFRDYTDDEFIDVATKVLHQREGLPMGLAVYIADQVLRRMKSRDVRDAVRVCRLLRKQTRDDADTVISILAKQK